MTSGSTAAWDGRHIVVMGVSGTGKSEIGARVADALGLAYVEGDAHHPAANIEKMSAGTPLTDDDRWPWLRILAAELDERRADDQAVVLGCSALRRVYRDVLRDGHDDVVFLHLAADFDVLFDRMSTREHFMPASLLTSQLETLEPLEPDEAGVQVDVDAPIEEVVRRSLDALTTHR